MERTRIMQPVNRSLNEPVTLGGVDYRLLLGILLASVVIFLVLSKWGGAMILCGAPLAAWWFTRREPKMFALWSLSFQQRSHYDPGKRK
jgi:type IV secretory pathway TrbD component